MENYKQSNSSLATLDIDIENQKDDINLGIFTRNILMRLFNNRQSATTVYNQEHCSSTM